jgi:hypothetical protein
MSSRVIWCWLLLLVFPPSVLDAQSQSAMVMVSGVAALNGTAMAASATIFAGDLLESRLGSLTIDAKGTTILIGANSRVRYFGNSIELQLGSTQVNTFKDMIVETETIKVGPNKISAKFLVDRAPRTIVISALKQEVRVDNNGDSRVLPPGTNVTLVEQDQGQPPSPVGGPSNKKLFVYAAIGTGTAAAILILKNDKKRPCNNQISEFKFCD